MVAASSPERSLHLAAVLVCCCAGALAAGGFTAWLHNLLADNERHPLPQRTQCAFGVVLGYALHRNGTCTRPLKGRVEVGVNAFEQGDAALLIFSGAHPGAAPRNVSEANAMLSYAQTLVQEPVPEGRWLLEEASTSTRTNAWFSLDIIAAAQQQQQQQQDTPALLIVTSPFHQLRSYYTFRRAAEQKGLSIQLYTAKAPFAGHCGYGHWLLDGLMDQVDFWRELAALGYYGVRGWL